jgi:HD-like signal output (HDOD) protein
MTEQHSLIHLINKALEEGTVELPVFDNIAVKIHREARENKLDAEGICKILEADPVLVSEVLRLSNSTFFSGLAEVKDLRAAAVRLGVKQLASIVMSVSQKRMYSASKGPFKARMVKLWLHGSAVSMASRWISNQAGYKQLADEVFVAGLLHDVGKLSLLRIIEELAKEHSMPLTNELVDMTLQQLYCSHGAQLVKLWGLPDSFGDIILQQADEQPNESNVALMIVRLADKASALEGISDFPDSSITLESLPETSALGLSEIDIAELRIMLEDIRGPGSAAA